MPYPVVGDGAQFPEGLDMPGVAGEVALLVRVGVQVVKLLGGALVIIHNPFCRLRIRFCLFDPGNPEIVALRFGIVVGLNREI